jgi:4-carboxymuconolactone decarboxylase
MTGIPQERGHSDTTDCPPPQASVESLTDGIYADSRNRLPVVKRESLDELGRSLYDAIVGGLRSGMQLAGFQGPGGIMLYSPNVAKSESAKFRYLRSQSGIGRRVYELAILTTARELDQQFEWSAHEPAALSAGVSQEVLHVIKFRKATTGLEPKDATVIQLGREVFRRRAVDLATFRTARALFGDRDLVDIVSVMAQYASTAILLNAFDQQLPEGRRPLLPIP